MKKLIATFTLLYLSLSLSAQTGSFGALKDAYRVNLVLDFTKASIRGCTEEEFSMIEEDWDKDQPDIFEKFAEGMTESLGDAFFVGKFKTEPYTVKVIVQQVGFNGEYTCYMQLEDSQHKCLGTSRVIEGRGGKVGSVLNLIKDGAIHAGKKCGSALKRLINKP